MTNKQVIFLLERTIELLKQGKTCLDSNRVITTISPLTGLNENDTFEVFITKIPKQDGKIL